MRVLRTVGLVGAGLLLGAGATLSVRADQGPAAGNRLFFIDAGTNSKTSGLVFIKDTKTEGCWLGVDTRGSGITSIAPAPPGACK